MLTKKDQPRSFIVGSGSKFKPTLCTHFQKIDPSKYSLTDLSLQLLENGEIVEAAVFVLRYASVSHSVDVVLITRDTQIMRFHFTFCEKYLLFWNSTSGSKRIGHTKEQ